MTEPLSEAKLKAIRQRLAELPTLASMFAAMGQPMIGSMIDLQARGIMARYMGMLARSPYIATLEATCALGVPALLAEVERLKAALEAAMWEHRNCDMADGCLASRDSSALAECNCGATAHNAAIDKALGR